MNDLEIINGTHVMDSRKIAELTGKDHSNVCRDIRTMLDNLGGELSFESSYKTQQGKEVTCFKLPRRECLILVSGYDVKLRAAIIDRWESLEMGKAKPTSLPKNLPNGKQIEMLARIYGSAEAAKRMDFLLGYRPVPDTLVDAVVPHPRTQLQIPSRNPDAVEGALRPVIQRFSPKVEQTMLGAGYAAAKREESRRAQWNQNGKLFGDEAQA